MYWYSDVAKIDFKEVELGGVEAINHYALLIDKDGAVCDMSISQREQDEGKIQEQRQKKLNKTTTGE